jgi:hypothetical protein
MEKKFYVFFCFLIQSVAAYELKLYFKNLKLKAPADDLGVFKGQKK